MMASHRYSTLLLLLLLVALLTNLARAIPKPPLVIEPKCVHPSSHSDTQAACLHACMHGPAASQQTPTHMYIGTLMPPPACPGAWSGVSQW